MQGFTNGARISQRVQPADQIADSALYLRIEFA